LAEKYKNEKIDHIVAVEARGFILGGVLAYKLGVGFVPVRKKGKLPFKTQSYTYDLEYGTDTLEIHEDAIRQGERILIVDDLLATGGTVEAVVNLTKKFGAEIVGICFLIELVDLKGRERLKDYPIYSLIEFEGE
jgi:adenine phosphoribosyltransferase